MKKICHDIVSTFTTNYIHKQFITNGPSWIQTTWNWLTTHISGLSSGDTLVDVVTKVFSGIDTAISKVKNIASQALNAVKDGLQFIANAVLSPIVDGFVYVLQNILHTIGTMLASIDNSSGIINTPDGLNIAGIDIKITRADLGITFSLNNLQIQLPNILVYSELNIETLSVVSGDVAANMQAGWIIGKVLTTLGIRLLAAGSQTYGIGYVAAIALFLGSFYQYITISNSIKSILSDTSYTKDSRIGLRDAMSAYFIGEFLGVWTGYAVEKTFEFAKNKLNEVSCAECNTENSLMPRRSGGISEMLHDNIIHFEKSHKVIFSLIEFISKTAISNSLASILIIDTFDKNAIQLPYADSLLLGMASGSIDYLVGTYITTSGLWDTVQRVVDFISSFGYLMMVFWIQSLNIPEN